MIAPSTEATQAASIPAAMRARIPLGHHSSSAAGAVAESFSTCTTSFTRSGTNRAAGAVSDKRFFGRLLREHQYANV